jgi:diacylglycerol kinase (ATP)
MARALLITNPIAARNSPERTEIVRRTLVARGWRLDVEATTGPGHARRLAAEAVTMGLDAVIVLGGDGTTTQAASALVGTDVALGLVPGGTGNLLAGNLRIPSSPVPAAELIALGRSRRIDLGRLDRSDGPHYFAVGCGAGADARIMGETATDAKRRFGMGGYIATIFRVLPEIRSTPVRITIDDTPLERPAALVLALNCAEIVPRVLRVREGAELDDGLLDLIVISADTPWEVIRAVWRVFQNVVVSGGETAYLAYARGQRITIEASDPLPVQYDGEAAGSTPATISVVPGALRVMAPTP